MNKFKKLLLAKILKPQLSIFPIQLIETQLYWDDLVNNSTTLETWRVNFLQIIRSYFLSIYFLLTFFQKKLLKKIFFPLMIQI